MNEGKEGAKETFLNFIRHDLPSRKTPKVHVENKSGESLGVILFYPNWRRFVFCPSTDTIFDSSCLSDIKSEVDRLQDEWKNKIQERRGKVRETMIEDLQHSTQRYC